MREHPTATGFTAKVPQFGEVWHWVDDTSSRTIIGGTLVVQARLAEPGRRGRELGRVFPHGRRTDRVVLCVPPACLGFDSHESSEQIDFMAGRHQQQEQAGFRKEIPCSGKELWRIAGTRLQIANQPKSCTATAASFTSRRRYVASSSRQYKFCRQPHPLDQSRKPRFQAEMIKFRTGLDFK
jgi:hypothetical protein